MEVNQPPSDEALSEAVRLYEEHGNNAAAGARAAGVAPSTFKDRLCRAAAKGMMLKHPPAMPGFRISQVTTNESGGQSIQQRPELSPAKALPAGHVVKGVSRLQNGEGDILLEWVKTREERDAADFVAIIKEGFKDFEGSSKPIIAPAIPQEDLLTLTPVNDLHAGMFSWGKDTGTDWDLKIFERVVGQAADTLVDRQKSCGTAIILGGGDLLHADNKDNKTARSGNVLDVDGRYEKVLQTATRLKVRIIDRHLERHGRVIVRILPGNHDEHSAVAVAYFLLAWYRNEPRVTVDIDPSLFFWYRFGKVMIGATHGHTVKLEKMASIMAHRRAEDWGATKFRYIHGFHIHHHSKFATEGEGVISESHQAPIPPDAWHFGAGYLSGRSMQSICYARDFGEIGRVREAIIDAANDNNPPSLQVAA